MPKHHSRSPASYLPVSLALIERRIYLIRGENVMLDRDLAELYQVKPIALRQQVKRNYHRFPRDFMFQLTQKEAEFLVSQNVIPSRRSLGGSLPYVFTQEGLAMLSSVLNSERGVQVNIAIMRTFVKLRRILAGNQELAQRLADVEKKYDTKFKVVFQLIAKLMDPPDSSRKRPFGFQPPTKPSH